VTFEGVPMTEALIDDLIDRVLTTSQVTPFDPS